MHELRNLWIELAHLWESRTTIYQEINTAMTRQTISSIHSPFPSLRFLLLSQLSFSLATLFINLHFHVCMQTIYLPRTLLMNSGLIPNYAHVRKYTSFFLSNFSAYFAVAQLHTRQTLGSHPYLHDGCSDCIFGFLWIIGIKIRSISEIAWSYLNSAFLSI